MQGPTAAKIRVAPRARISSTVASITPAARPRQPAWATPITPSSLARATGAQSAVRTAMAHPGRSVTAPPARFYVGPHLGDERAAMAHVALGPPRERDRGRRERQRGQEGGAPLLHFRNEGTSNSSSSDPSSRSSSSSAPP